MRLFAHTVSSIRHTTLSAYSCRQHSLSRWLFCDVLQISEGPQRWMRYFLARRRVEARIDTGRPGRDYRVRSRDHVCYVVDFWVSERGEEGQKGVRNAPPPVYVESVRIQPQVRTLPPFRGNTVDVISVPQDVRYVVDFWLSERGEEGQKGVRAPPFPPLGETLWM